MTRTAGFHPINGSGTYGATYDYDESCEAVGNIAACTDTGLDSTSMQTGVNACPSSQTYYSVLKTSQQNGHDRIHIMADALKLYAGQEVTLTFAVADVGDTKYVTALAIEDIYFQ